LGLQVSVSQEGEDKGPICPPLPAQYHPAGYNTTTPQLHKTITDYAGSYKESKDAQESNVARTQERRPATL